MRCSQRKKERGSEERKVSSEGGEEASLIDLGVADRLRWIYETTRRRAIIIRAPYEDDGVQLKRHNSRTGKRKERWLVSINKMYDPVRYFAPGNHNPERRRFSVLFRK